MASENDLQAKKLDRRKAQSTLPREVKPTGHFYTEEMRQRALDRIRRKRENEDPEELYSAYIGLMYRTLSRRANRERGDSSVCADAAD